jgi:hypothetical protein
MEKANRKQTIFTSKPLGIAAWFLLANCALELLKTVSLYWRVGLLKTSTMQPTAAWISSCAGL